MAKKHLAFTMHVSSGTTQNQGVSSTVDVSDMQSVVVHVAAVGTGTYKVMGSYNGSNFIQIGSDLTSDGSQAIGHRCCYCRRHGR